MPVTPLAGVWVEILQSRTFIPPILVTPLAGVWVEMVVPAYIVRALRSLPLRECGLKSEGDISKSQRRIVTPLAGVWVEISDKNSMP